MKVYIRSGKYESEEDVDEEAHPIVTYYNFLLDHQNDLNNYLKRKIQQYFGVIPSKYRVYVDKPFLYDNGFTDIMDIGIYAEIDVVTANLSEECKKHIIYDDSGHDPSLGYDGHNFYGILYTHTYSLYPDDLSSLDYAYNCIDECLEYYEKHGIDNFIKNLNEDINYVQNIYDEFKDDADLQFVIDSDSIIQLKIYDKNTGYIIYDDTIYYHNDDIDSEKDIYEALDKYVYSPDNGDYVSGHVIVKYDKKNVKVNSELKPKMNSISQYLQHNWDCIVRPHKEYNSGSRLEFNIVCKNQQDFQEIVNYIKNNIFYDVSLEVTFDHYVASMSKLIQQFLNIYGE